jgi:DNA modification methylase
VTYYTDDQVTLHHGDALDVAKELPAAAVDCIVTSPPYFGLRDYGTEGQYGLESSPAEYVETMRALFNELRRVLADDGTLWLNIGDSYVGNASPGGESTRTIAGKPNANRPISVTKPGIPKNLMGIPWRVARALQEPQYTGTIHSEVDRAWLAALIDGEGCIAIHRRMDEGRKRPTYAPMLQVSNTNLPILERCLEVAGVGSISHSDRGRNRRIYRWCVTANQARQVLREVYPHLIAKQPQARAAIAATNGGRRGEPDPGAERAWLEIKALNKGGNHDGGWPTPASCFDPGWILRNAVIWAKPNAMPESVRDRLSGRYEHVFLFAKQPRYWFDLDPIREPHVTGDRALVKVPRGSQAWSANASVGQPQQCSGTAGVGRDANGRNPGDVWTIPTQPFSAAHFAVMPVQLATRCILAGCKPGGTVLDPFSGSGTTGLAAQRTGRRYIGIDLNAEYLEMSLNTRLREMPLDFEEPA